MNYFTDIIYDKYNRPVYIIQRGIYFIFQPFNENEENLEDYFDFDNTDDVDFDEEDAVLRNVLKFTDCNNFEIPINDLIIEDFIYEISTKSIDDLIDDTLNKTANDAFEKSEGSVSSDSINNSLNTKFIKNLPRGVILSIMTPKIVFPITLTYKLFKSLTTTVIETKELFDLKVKTSLYIDLSGMSKSSSVAFKYKV